MDLKVVLNLAKRWFLSRKDLARDRLWSLCPLSQDGESL